jgi:hypothetical protein
VRPNLFKRNLIGLLIVVGALGVLYVTKLGPAFSHYRDTGRPEHIAAPGAGTPAYGWTWRVESADRRAIFPGPLVKPLPPGTKGYLVTVAREGTGPATLCRGVLTDGTRRFAAEGLGPRAPTPPLGTSTTCTASGPVQFAFIVPRDVAATAVDVVGPNDQIMVRLQL